MNPSFDNNLPIYLQLVEQLIVHIISGKYFAGERLPSVRDLALQLKVNPNTVQKALLELENRGLIFTERTNGKFVTEDVSLIERQKVEYADMLTKGYMEAMEKIGFGNNDVLKLIKSFGGNE